MGYFPNGIRPDSNDQIGNYEMFGPYYDDEVMREALENLRESGDWNPRGYRDGGYDLLKYNCQDFSDALREECEDFGGETCSNPFVGGSCSTSCRQTRRGMRCN